MAKDKSVKVVNKGIHLGGMYFIAFIGAAVYFVQQSNGFWGAILGILKAFVWPGFVVYKALLLMHA